MPDGNAHGGKKAVIAAFTANIAISISKAAAYFFTASPSMLAEAIHSCADAANQLLLLFGQKQSKKAADSLHPFGYGREQYFYAFMVSVVLFLLGGCFAIMEAAEKISSPSASGGPLWLALLILAFSFLLECYSFFVALKETHKAKGGKSYWEFVLKAK
ncbi:MAG: cation transporter, partial [Acidaminococcales bacterium]|nr:cation transporter [Acidaminococcales bacterium]